MWDSRNVRIERRKSSTVDSFCWSRYTTMSPTTTTRLYSIDYSTQVHTVHCVIAITVSALSVPQQNDGDQLYLGLVPINRSWPCLSYLAYYSVRPQFNSSPSKYKYHRPPPRQNNKSSPRNQVFGVFSEGSGRGASLLRCAESEDKAQLMLAMRLL